MANLNRRDYKYLFDIGRKLYTGDITAKQAGTILMAMSEYIIGQQAPWPRIHKWHRPLTIYRKQNDETHLDRP